MSAKRIGRSGALNARKRRLGKYQRWGIDMPSQKEVLSAIASGELFTPEYQERERQRKMALKLERQKQRKVMDRLLDQEYARMRAYAKEKSIDVYAGKKSGDYVGD